MRFAFIAASLAYIAGFAWAQAANDDNPADKSGYSTGRTTTPGTKGEKQPQGSIGPTLTGVGGAPPESPQGDTPPGMQSAPEGSSKKTVEPDKSETK